MRRAESLVISLILILSGCASPFPIASMPLVVSRPPLDARPLPVKIALVRLDRPLKLDKPYDVRFLSALADSLEAGMLAACRITAEP